MLIRLHLITLICLMSFSWYSMAKNTGEKLTALRNKMKENNLAAYIIPSEDEHQSEYTADYDKKRQWLSDFTGSSGVAVVTLNSAALWTDSRYHIRADKELDKDYWILMKSGEENTPSIDTWLSQQLNSGDRVGENGKLVSISEFRSRINSLAKFNFTFVNVEPDIINNVWTDRPQKPSSKITIHDVKFNGETWKSKLERTQKRIDEVGADLYVVTALDEVAWFFNLRSADIPYNPMFFAYAIVFKTGPSRLYINEARIIPELKAHLADTVIRPYESITEDIRQFSQENKKIWISPMSSYAIFSAVANSDLLINDKPSPIRSFKSIKNKVEIEEARKCQIRDSAARIKHMYWLENAVKNGERVTEVSSAAKLEEIQSKDSLYRSLSFDSISAVGAHAADIHFSTNEEENEVINKTRIYLLDAGAQYEDCTTDITRTHHFGTPTEKEILAYTKVLQGSIDLANLVFPYDVDGRLIDVAARSPLWKSGLNYDHGTGHGIGFCLGVHENPPYGPRAYNEFYLPGMFQSDEPGYYEKGFFGIRLETDLEVVEAKTTFNFRKFMKFEAHSLVPFDKNLINVDLLTKDQLTWLEMYYKNIREKVGPLLKNDKKVYEFLLEKTETIKPSTSESTSNGVTKNQSTMNLVYLAVLLMIILVL